MRLANSNNKLCYKGMIKLQVQEIQSLNQKHSEVWPDFIIPCVHMLWDDH